MNRLLFLSPSSVRETQSSLVPSIIYLYDQNTILEIYRSHSVIFYGDYLLVIIIKHFIIKETENNFSTLTTAIGSKYQKNIFTFLPNWNMMYIW